jgi:hypothetical protein
MVKKKKNEVWTYIIATVLFCILLVNLYLLWNTVTGKVSAKIDCSINNIEYVRLENGSGECLFPLVKGNVSMCALPRDFHCDGLIQNFPLLRAILEMRISSISLPENGVIINLDSIDFLAEFGVVFYTVSEKNEVTFFGFDSSISTIFIFSKVMR